MSTERPQPPARSAREAHRLHRDPEHVDGLEKGDQESRSSEADDRRSETAPKGYATETEIYTDPTIDRPDDADQRRDGTEGTRGTGSDA